ncbi:MAG: uncharacterized protein KVP18_002818 [Porospora cf. gigantea A]|uniref:uncharacterized protein n=1 Tax=Porospora cf. gigantea A TaxID=2853593 RepID=UPI00355964BD|nr:MAG: hypothetical protein KVP18_002818 [Porospora cf. gigantea A]
MGQQCSSVGAHDGPDDFYNKDGKWQFPPTGHVHFHRCTDDHCMQQMGTTAFKYPDRFADVYTDPAKRSPAERYPQCPHEHHAPYPETHMTECRKSKSRSSRRHSDGFVDMQEKGHVTSMAERPTYETTTSSAVKPYPPSDVGYKEYTQPAPPGYQPQPAARPPVQEYTPQPAARPPVQEYTPSEPPIAMPPPPNTSSMALAPIDMPKAGDRISLSPRVSPRGRESFAPVSTVKGDFRTHCELDAWVRDKCRSTPLFIKTIILPEGVSPNDPRLENAEVVSSRTYELPAGSGLVATDEVDHLHVEVDTCLLDGEGPAERTIPGHSYCR